MKEHQVKFGEIVDRKSPDFVVKYECLDPFFTLPSHGLLMKFVYEEDLWTKNCHCDILPEFRADSNGRIVAPNEPLVKSGIADMWIISNSGREDHDCKLQLGKKCFFVHKGKVVIACEIVHVLEEVAALIDQ